MKGGGPDANEVNGGGLPNVLITGGGEPPAPIDVPAVACRHLGDHVRCTTL